MKEDNEEQVIDNFMDELDYYDDEMVNTEVRRKLTEVSVILFV